MSDIVFMRNDYTGIFSYVTENLDISMNLIKFDGKTESMPDEFPILKKNSLNLKILPSVKMEVSSEGKAKMNLNMASLSHDLEFIIGPKASFGIQPIFAGEGSFQNDTWNWESCSVGVSESGSLKLVEQLPTIGPIPIPNYVTVVFSLKLDGSLVFKVISPPEFSKGTFGFKPAARASWDLGVIDLLGGGGWIEIGGGFKWDSAFQLKQTEGSVNSKGGVEVVILGRKWEREIFNCVWDFVKEDGGCSTASIRSNSSVLVERDYLDKTGMFAKTTRDNASSSIVPLQTSVYPYSDSDVSANSSVLYAVWLSDNPSRTSVNRTQAVFSSWNGTAWTDPKAIADDGTADFHPKVLTFSDNSALAAWEDMKNTLADTAQLEEMAQNLEISVSKYDPQTGQWTGTQRLTDNAYLDRSPKLAGKPDNAIVTWISNEGNDIIGSAAKPNKLWYAKWAGNAWSAPNLIAEIPYPILQYNVVYDGQTGYLLFSADTDGDLSTATDHELFQIAFSNGAWGTPNRLTTDSVEDSNPQLYRDVNGNFVLFWLKGSEISSVTNFAMDKRTVIRKDDAGYSSNLANFKLASSGDEKLALVWAEPSKQNSSDLYALFYDYKANLIGFPTRLTSDEYTEQRVAASFFGNDKLVAIYNRKVVGSGATNNLTDLYMLKHTVMNYDFWKAPDVNGDGEIDLTDAILGLRILSDVKILNKINSDADINGDRKIGMEEVVSVLQRVSVLQ